MGTFTVIDLPLDYQARRTRTSELRGMLKQLPVGQWVEIQLDAPTVRANAADCIRKFARERGLISRMSCPGVDSGEELTKFRVLLYSPEAQP